MFHFYKQPNCKIPIVTRASLNIVDRKVTNDYQRPRGNLSDIIINDSRTYKPPSPRRKIRPEDINIRPRVLAPSAKGRLTNEERVQYTKEIQDAADKYAMIGEKVITKLFQAQVNDPADVEYINRRNKLISTGLSKEEADNILISTFRPQYKTKKAVDLTRMDVLIPDAISIVKQVLSQKPVEVNDIAQSVDVINDAMLNNMISVEDIKNTINLLVTNPMLRRDYKPGEAYELLGMLSNIVVGNEYNVQSVGNANKPVAIDLQHYMQSEGIVLLADLLNTRRMDIKKFIEDNTNNDLVADEDDIIDGNIEPTVSGNVYSVEPEDVEELAEFNPEDNPEISNEDKFKNELYEVLRTSANKGDDLYDLLKKYQFGDEKYKILVSELFDEEKDRGDAYFDDSQNKNDVLQFIEKELEEPVEEEEQYELTDYDEPLEEQNEPLADIKKEIKTTEKKIIAEITKLPDKEQREFFMKKLKDTMKKIIKDPSNKILQDLLDEFFMDVSMEAMMQDVVKESIEEVKTEEKDFKVDAQMIIEKGGKDFVKNFNQIIEKYSGIIEIKKLKSIVKEITQENEMSDINQKLMKIIDTKTKELLNPGIPVKQPVEQPVEEKKEEEKKDETMIIEKINKLNPENFYDITVKDLKQLITDYNKMVENKGGESYRVRGSSNMKAADRTKFKSLLKEKLAKWEEISAPVKIEKKNEPDEPTSLRPEKDISKPLSESETSTELSTIGLMKTWKEKKNILDGITNEGKKMMQNPDNYIEDKKLTLDDILIFLNKNLPYIYDKLSTVQQTGTKNKQAVVNKIKSFMTEYQRETFKKDLVKAGNPKITATSIKPKLSGTPPPIATGKGMKTRGRPKKEKKPKQKREPSDWILFVKSVAKTENLKYRDALKVASLMKKK